MSDCRECDLAVYCFSEPAMWTFRTKEEMRQKQERIAACPSRPATNLGATEPGNIRGDGAVSGAQR